MQKFFVLATILLILMLFTHVSAHNVVYAQDFCDFVPCGANDPSEDPDGTEDDVATTIDNVIQVGSSLIFSGIIILGIYYTIVASLKIIRSEGDIEKVESGAKIIKGVYIGIVMIIIGIIGIVIITAFFGGSGIFTATVEDPDNFDIVL